MKDQNTILTELIKMQLKHIDSSKKLSYSDLVRIAKSIDKSIFKKNTCSNWMGYVTNMCCDKSSYVNFYFRGRKTALHRLLYSNFIGPIQDYEYIKFTCNNRGKCCNIHHLIKYKKDINTNDKDKDVEILIAPKFSLNFD